jgi:hypothetical protein
MVQGPETYHEVSSEVFSFPGYFIFRRNDGIIHVQFEAGFVGDIQDAKNQVQVFNQLRGDRKAVILGVFEEDNNFTREAREYVASDEVSAIVAAEAFVIKGLALRILGNGYLKINKPKRPARLFNSRTAALHWLRQFLD